MEERHWSLGWFFFPFSSPSSLPPPKQERKRAERKHRPELTVCHHNKLEVRPALLETEPQVLVARHKKRPLSHRPVNSGGALPRVLVVSPPPSLFFFKRKLWESGVTQQKFPFEPDIQICLAQIHIRWAGPTQSPPSLQFTNLTIKEQQRRG